MRRKDRCLASALNAVLPVVLGTMLFTALPAVSHAQDMHVTVVPQSAWGNVPASIPLDVKPEDCEAKGGQLGTMNRSGFRLCTIPTTQCETHKGFRVVERDAYRTGSSRLYACRFQ